MSVSNSQMITVSVWRGSVEGGELQDFEVPQQPSQTILDVVTWIQRNLDTSGGEIEAGKRRYLIRTIGRFRNIEDLKELMNTDTNLYDSKLRAISILNK